MLDLNDLRIFITIVEQRGILRAGRALDLPKSTISRRLAALEEQVKGRLVIRNGDEFQLTPLGAEIEAAGRAMVEAASAAEEVLARGRTEVRGRISLNLAPLFAPLIAESWPVLARRHPRLTLGLDCGERSLEAAGGFDLTLAAHCWPLRDSGFIQRRICRNPLILVTAAGRGAEAARPGDLAAAGDLLAYGVDPEQQAWDFTHSGGDTCRLQSPARLVSTETRLLCELAEMGAGTALLPEIAVRGALRAGRLQLAAPGWFGPAVTVALLSPERRLMNARLRVLADELGHIVKAAVLQDMGAADALQSLALPGSPSATEGTRPVRQAQAADEKRYSSRSSGPGAGGVPQLERAIPEGADPFVTLLSSGKPSPGGPVTQAVARQSDPLTAERDSDMTPFLKAFGVAALTATATLPQLAAAQDLPGPLVLYTNDFEGVITERFEADTGRQIDVVQMSGGELLARIAAETANPQWDVLIFNGSYSLHALDAQGQLKRDLEPANLGALNETGQGFLPESRGWFPIGLTASCVMAYRPDLVETPPATFADLADPRFNGAFGMADPAVAAPAYPCVAQFFHSMGQEGAEALFTQYFDNGLRVFRTNGPVGRALSAGEISLALITSQVAYSLKAAGEVPVEVIWPAEGAPGAVRGVAAQAATGRPEAARAFVDWLLTAETQAYLQEAAGPDGLFEPTVTGGPRRADGPAEGAVYRVAPDDFAVAEEAAIKSWFADRALQ